MQAATEENIVDVITLHVEYLQAVVKEQVLELLLGATVHRGGLDAGDSSVAGTLLSRWLDAEGASLIRTLGKLWGVEAPPVMFQLFNLLLARFEVTDTADLSASEILASAVNATEALDAIEAVEATAAENTTAAKSADTAENASAAASATAAGSCALGVAHLLPALVK